MSDQLFDADPKPVVKVDPKAEKVEVSAADRAFVRAENEDDDGYDPYSDRRPKSEPLFERDPWA